MKLVPYLNFPGNTEEVMNTYQKIFNGTLHDVGRFGDHNPQMPEDQKNRIMHARLTFGDNMLMFSDGMPGRPITNGDSISLSIGLDDEAQARSIFDQLSEGGKVLMPMEKQFWGAIFGMVTDKYGIQWMINCEPPTPKGE
ncbi:MAG TPA: VOC family protein [Mucilaginibacter sp.]|jgi:PhnB protein